MEEYHQNVSKKKLAETIIRLFPNCVKKRAINNGKRGTQFFNLSFAPVAHHLDHDYAGHTETSGILINGEKMTSLLVKNGYTILDNGGNRIVGIMPTNVSINGHKVYKEVVYENRDQSQSIKCKAGRTDVNPKDLGVQVSSYKTTAMVGALLQEFKRANVCIGVETKNISR